MIRRVCLLDTETTGLDPAKDACIEVAVVVFDLVLAVPTASFASLIRAPRSPDGVAMIIDNPAFDVNRIPSDLLADAPEPSVVWRRVEAIISGAEVVVAHRASFDKSFTPEPFRSARPWVCSKYEIDWPSSKPGDGLVHAALAHGVAVAHAHRAMTDCDILSRLLTRVAERQNLQELFVRAMRPRKIFVSFAPFDQKDAVKGAGFSWDDPIPGQWSRSLPPEDVAALPFRAVEWETCKLFVSLAPYEQKEIVKKYDFTWNDLAAKQWAKRMPPEDATRLPFAVKMLNEG